MTKKTLIESAESLKQPSPSSAKEFEGKAEFMAAEMNRFMSSVFLHFQPLVLVETLLWVYRAYRSHGFHLTYWPAQLNQWVELFKGELSSETYKEIYPFYHWMIVNQPVFVIESDKLLLNDN
jgi:hypothetical protein